MIKVGIDGRAVQVEKMAGINVYAHEVTKNLDTECDLYVRSKLQNRTLAVKDNINSFSLTFPSYRWKFDQIWETTALPYLVNKSKPDMFWGPRFFVPPRIKCPSIATIHDIAFLLIPGLVSNKQISTFSRYIKYSINNAAHFITVSETTKVDFCDYFNIKPEKVSAVYNGYNPMYKKALENEYIEIVRLKFGIPKDFILFLGTLEPRKNLLRLVKAFLASKAFSENIPLVLAGQIGWLNTELLDFIQPYIEKKNIILTGFLSNKELMSLYQSCLFFAFPSIYEGFGIPVLEAMASGAPVLTSNNSSMKEVFEGSALLVDPESLESITNGIEVLMDNDIRKEYKIKGEKLSEQFSWERCAKEHLEVFKSVV